MANTLKDIIDLARLSINDDAKVSYPDTELLNYANDAIQTLINTRPDLFIGGFDSLPTDNLEEGDDSPVDVRYRRAIADYVIARVNLKGTEESASAKANAYIQMFGAQL